MILKREMTSEIHFFRDLGMNKNFSKNFKIVRTEPSEMFSKFIALLIQNLPIMFSNCAIFITERRLSFSIKFFSKSMLSSVTTLESLSDRLLDRLPSSKLDRWPLLNSLKMGCTVNFPGTLSPHPCRSRQWIHRLYWMVNLKKDNILWKPGLSLWWRERKRFSCHRTIKMRMNSAAERCVLIVATLLSNQFASIHYFEIWGRPIQ